MITADWDTLLRQASMTIHDYLIHGVRCIDDKFGEGYAARHPELLAAFIQAAAQDFHSSTMAKIAGEVSEQLSAAVLALAESQGDA
jgi:hypothetical protein